jgi:hypothetical protein
VNELAATSATAGSGAAESLNAAERDELRVWLAARGKTLAVVEAPRPRLDQIFIEHVERNQPPGKGGRS